MTKTQQEPDTLLEERIQVRLPDGREVTVWNSVTIYKRRDIGPGRVKTSHDIRVGDGTLWKRPEYITPAVEEELRVADVYPYPEVVDWRDEDVEVQD